jgi:hypothetical protein
MSPPAKKSSQFLGMVEAENANTPKTVMVGHATASLPSLWLVPTLRSGLHSGRSLLPQGLPAPSKFPYASPGWFWTLEYRWQLHAPSHILRIVSPVLTVPCRIKIHLLGTHVVMLWGRWGSGLPWPIGLPQGGSISTVGRGEMVLLRAT